MQTDQKTTRTEDARSETTAAEHAVLAPLTVGPARLSLAALLAPLNAYQSLTPCAPTGVAVGAQGVREEAHRQRHPA